MRADATHRFEFEVDGGRGSPFVCLARTRSEAERVALHAGAAVRLVDSTRLGPSEGDAEARQSLRDDGLFRSRWRDDIAPIVELLDHVRHEPADAASIVPVAFAPADELQARGLRPCGCGRTRRDRRSASRRALVRADAAARLRSMSAAPPSP